MLAVQASWGYEIRCYHYLCSVDKHPGISDEWGCENPVLSALQKRIYFCDAAAKAYKNLALEFLGSHRFPLLRNKLEQELFVLGSVRREGCNQPGIDKLEISQIVKRVIKYLLKHQRTENIVYVVVRVVVRQLLHSRILFLVVLVQPAERGRNEVRLDIQVAQALVIYLVANRHISAVAIEIIVYPFAKRLCHALAHYLNCKVFKNSSDRLYQKPSAPVYLQIKFRISHVEITQLKLQVSGTSLRFVYRALNVQFYISQ